MNTKFIIMCAPNGARRTKIDHPKIPITAEEIAICAQSVLDAGAALLHVHVRDSKGAHSLDVDKYRDALSAINSKVGDNLVLQVTTESCGKFSRYDQMQMVRSLKPEAISLAINEICPDENTEKEAAKFYSWLNRERIMVQHILYTPEEVVRFSLLKERGIIPSQNLFLLFVLGRYTKDLIGDVSELAKFLEVTPEDAIWSVCCFGSTEYEAVQLASLNGGHARVGFENNLICFDGSIAIDNNVLVYAAATLGMTAGRSIATADDVRNLFVF